MSLTLKDVKTYLRVDSEVEDELLIRLMTVAENNIRDAVTDYDAKAADNAAFLVKSEMCQLIIISDLYENRELGTAKDYGYTIRSMLAQLQYTPTPEAIL